MTEKSHAEMEQYHYQALSHPEYQLEGTMSVMREEMFMAMPLSYLQEKETVLSIIPPEHRLYGELQQLKNKVLYLQEKFNLHLDKSKTNRYTIS